MKDRLLSFTLQVISTVIAITVGLKQLSADESHWAFRSTVRPDVPQGDSFDNGSTAIDRFVLSKLHNSGLSYSPTADRTTLCRRAFLDLIGLPPSPDEVDAFLADGSPDAYERLLDRLLSSPHFGERWGRHWLDVAGYTDTVGFDIDANNIIIPKGKWRYRHYVIDSFNADKPYDQFVREQIAGDELVNWRNAEEFTDEIREHLIATGFLRTAQDFTHEPESNIALNQFAVLHDTLEIVGSSLLGLTLQCARCHDHKFDPVTQKDYYRLMALLTPAYNPQAWKPVFPWKPEIVDRGLPDVPQLRLKGWMEDNQRLDDEIQKRQHQIAEIRDQCKKRLQERRDSDADAPAPKQPAEISDQQITEALQDDEQKSIADLQQQIAALNGRKQTWDTIQALYDVGPPPETHVLDRGSHETPGEIVSPGFIAILSDEKSAATQDPGGEPTGHRRALADWLTKPETPASSLLSRVMMNRVCQHLFGRGLVPTPENFGLSGEPPTHPQLLEWLSSELPRREWRVKPLIRELMSSHVYRQTSHVSPAVVVGHADSENRLWWRMPLRQLDAEVIRDSILSATGELQTALGGPPVLLFSRPDGLVEIDEKRLSHPSERNRRSVYLLFRRAYNLSLLTVFDEPFIATTCAQRNTSAVVSQSLTMLNDEFLFQQADSLASRVAREAGHDQLRQIERAFRLVLARLPNDHERDWCLEFLTEQSRLAQAPDEPADPIDLRPLSELCRALFNTSEFLYAE